jgi:pilus assembly protein TadC
MQNFSGLSLNDRLMGSKTSSKEGFVSFELSQDDTNEIFEGSANKVNLSFLLVVIVLGFWNFASFVKKIFKMKVNLFSFFLCTNILFYIYADWY